MSERFLRFGAIGIVGFLVDAGVLIANVEIAGLSPLPARVLSFLVAATATFVLNQRFTFHLGGRFVLSRWVYYLAATAAGACVNVGIYRIWIGAMGAAPADLVMGTAIGSLSAMLLNYFVSSAFVFRQIQKPAD